MAINCKYGDGWTSRTWTNQDGNAFSIVCDEAVVTIKADFSRESDVETFKAQLNNAIQDWRTYKAKGAGRDHSGSSTNDIGRKGNT